MNTLVELHYRLERIEKVFNMARAKKNMKLMVHCREQLEDVHNELRTKFGVVDSEVPYLLEYAKSLEPYLST